MTRLEFGKIMAYIGAGIGKLLESERAEVYWDLLGELPAPVLMVAAKRVLLSHKWATFPSVAELREASAMTVQGEVADLSPAEAWHMAWRAVGRIDPELAHTMELARERLPARVWEAIRAFGVPAMCYGGEPVGVVRAHFLKIYEQLASRDQRRALLPATIREQVKDLGERKASQLPAKVQLRLAKIGQLPK